MTYAAIGVIFVAVIPSAGAAASIPVEVEEHVDASCSGTSLLQRLEQRGVDAVRVTRGGKATLKVEIRKNGPVFDGALTIRQESTPQEVRHASSPSCDEVFDALVTIASIALFEMDPARSSPADDPTAGSGNSASPQVPPAPRHDDAFHLHVGVGAELSLLGDGRGSLAIPFAVRLSHRRMPTLRLAAMSRKTGLIASDGAAVDVDIYLGRLDLGPSFTLARGWLSIQLAWSAEVGFVSGKLATGTGPLSPRAWWASGAAVYTRFGPRWGDLELGAGAVVPILRAHFQHEGQPPFFQIPAVVPWAGLSGSLSIF